MYHAGALQASYDDDEDDEAEALLAAVAPDMVGASTPGNRFGLFRGGTGSSDLVGANRSFAGYNDSGLDVGGGAMTADGGGLYVVVVAARTRERP